jgi:hypothetical protein
VGHTGLGLPGRSHNNFAKILNAPVEYLQPGSVKAVIIGQNDFQ